MAGNKGKNKGDTLALIIIIGLLIGCLAFFFGKEVTGYVLGGLSDDSKGKIIRREGDTDRNDASSEEKYKRVDNERKYGETDENFPEWEVDGLQKEDSRKGISVTVPSEESVSVPSEKKSVSKKPEKAKKQQKRKMTGKEKESLRLLEESDRKNNERKRDIEIIEESDRKNKEKKEYDPFS